MKTYQSTSSTTALKRRATRKALYIGVVIFAILAIVTTVTLGVVLNRDNTPAGGDPDVPTNTKPVFVLPLDEFTVAQEVNFEEFVYNPSLNAWRTVTGMTFASDAGTDINAVCDGKIIGIVDTVLDGRAITVEHTAGYISIYKSLDMSEATTLQVGQTIKAGQKLGTTSNSMQANAHFGNQLYLQLKQDGKFIDPASVLPAIDK
ncbi:MAG: M23 family metallopeptidase [Firmicutes bacterium]|nr:M23 family metallopeptidase [Bacillota bacterium]